MKVSFRAVAALSLATLAASSLSSQAHIWDKKGYADLKNDSQYFAHAKSARAKINKPFPYFAVQTLDGKGLTKASFKGKMGLFVLADTACPCVQAIEQRVSQLSKKYGKDGLRVVYVFSMPKERPIQIARFMQNHQLPYPAMLDRDQTLLKMLNGQCSSETYLMDKAGILRYHGRVDDSTFDPKAIKSRDLENAIVAVTKGKRVAKSFAPALGCAIPRI